MPDYHEKETSRWVVFPWEIKEPSGKSLRNVELKGNSWKMKLRSL